MSVWITIRKWIDDSAGVLDLAKANDDSVVHDTGNETVAGVKTFSSFPVTPSEAPTTDYQAANKKYVDDNAGGGHTQNTDTGTTENTFTVDSDSTTGKIIVDVALGAADLSLTLTNEALTSTSKTITFPNATGTVSFLALGTTSATAHRGDYGNTAYNHSQAAHAPSNADNTAGVIAAGSVIYSLAEADRFALLKEDESLAIISYSDLLVELTKYFDTLYTPL
jgi:hypothetical protein